MIDFVPRRPESHITDALSGPVTMGRLSRERSMRMLSLMIFGALAVVGGHYFYSQGLSLTGTAMAQSPTPSGTTAGSLADLTTLSDRFETVSRYVLPAVVSIEARKPITGASAGAALRTTEDSGSGVIVAAVDSPGTIVITNNHVISGARPEQININLADG